jgi:orsellinic acid C2-O-methyltransferase
MSDEQSGPPANLMLQQFIGGSLATNLVYIAAELGIADQLANGPKKAQELAAATGTQAGPLKRILRGLAVLGVFAQTDEGAFSLTPLGQSLRSDVAGSMRTTARLQAHPAAQLAFGALIQTVRSGKPAFDSAHGQDFFEYAVAHPDFFDLFNDFMGGVTDAAVATIIPAYDFAGVRTVVDVGGGNGALVRAALRANDWLEGTITDVSNLARQAEEAIAQDGLGERCRFVVADFFEHVLEGADAYLLKSVIHDWDDERALRIYANVRRAMRDDSRLLLVEALNEPDVVRPDVIMGDLIMLTMATGRERSEAEHREMLSQSGLRLERIIPTASGSSILEARPAN